VKLPQQNEYRWQEVSYWSSRGNTFQPFASSDVRTADMAASNGMGLVNIAFGPAAIDDEKEDDFHHRWIWLLAKAADGQLRYPRTLPIIEWPPRFA
jgi:hypothetical protein